MNKFHEVREEFIKNKEVTQLPVRATKSSAGYDFYLKEDVLLKKPTLKLKEEAIEKLKTDDKVSGLVDIITNSEDNFDIVFDQKLCWTDVTAELEENTFLGVHIRSSIGTKKGIVLANVTGIIDKDYHDNVDNGGNIGLMLKNIGNEDVLLKAGERIAQGIVYDFGTVSDDKSDSVREGGFGSSNK